MSALYEKDFYKWCNHQEEALVSGHIEQIDLKNLAEELRDLGEHKRFELVNAFSLLFMHILKWQYQSHLRTKSWINTINHRRIAINRILSRNPSLKAQIADCVDEAYEDARYHAAKETGLDIETFPKERNFILEFAMEFEFII